MKVIIATILALFTALSGLISNTDMKAEFRSKGDISGYAQTVNVQKDLPDFETDKKGDFTMLQFSDTHFKTCASFGDLLLLNKMKEQVEKTDPDLVVITGDMINDGDNGIFSKSYALRQIAEIFEETDQYWAYVPGNNDGLNYGTSADVAAYLMQYEHCLVSDDPQISGGTQYSIDITDKGELTHSLVFIDTMDYDNEDDNYTYGYVHEDQVKWVEREIASKKAENPDVKVSVFMHENTPNFLRATNNGKAYKANYSTVMLTKGQDIPKNQPLDDVLEGSGCVGLVSIGHTHPATSQCSFYNGTYYHIAPQTVLASVMITIHTDEGNTKSMYDFDPMYL